MPKWTFENKFTTGNIVQIGMILLALVGGWYGLVNRVDAAADSIEDLQRQVATITDLGSRVSTIETRINIGQLAREQFQEETKQALREQGQVLTQILQVQAAILARLEERNIP